MYQYTHEQACRVVEQRIAHRRGQAHRRGAAAIRAQVRRQTRRLRGH